MVNSVTAARVGFTTGRNTFSKITHWDPPSIMAASNDLGTPRKAFISRITFPSGTAPGNISAQIVLVSFSEFTTIKVGIRPPENSMANRIKDIYTF